MKAEKTCCYWIAVVKNFHMRDSMLSEEYAVADGEGSEVDAVVVEGGDVVVPVECSVAADVS